MLLTQADDTEVHDAMLYTLRTGRRPRKQPLVVPELRGSQADWGGALSRGLGYN